VVRLTAPTLSDAVIDEVARLKALLITYGGDKTSPPIVAITGLLTVSERLDEQQQALTRLVRDFAGDRIAGQFRAEAVKAWRAVVPQFNRTTVWTRRLAIVRDLALICCAVAVVLLVWLRPIIDVSQVASQCADARNLTQQDGGVYCTMRVWVKPPTKGRG
jgi:hypothetical protein